MGKQRGDCWRKGLPLDVHVEVRTHQERRVISECLQRQIVAALRVTIEVWGQEAQASAMGFSPRARVVAILRGHGDPVDQGARKDPKQMDVREGSPLRIGIAR